MTAEPSESNINANITVKFSIDEYQTVAQVYGRDTSIQTILTDIAEKFQINSKYLQILHDSVALASDVKLHELCHNEFQIVDFELRLNALAKAHNDSVDSENDKIQLDCDVYYRYELVFSLNLVIIIIHRYAHFCQIFSFWSQSLSVVGFCFRIHSGQRQW